MIRGLLTRGTLLACALVAGGCAEVWGFDDLTLGPDAALDATSEDASHAEAGVEAGSGSDAADDAFVAEDSSDGDAASADGSDAEASEASGPKGDGAPGGPTCASSCTGCCDAMGKCQPSISATACGIAGAACVTCPTTSCLLLGACCGQTTGVCGCSGVGTCSKN
jgi:hypothetical protein